MVPLTGEGMWTLWLLATAIAAVPADDRWIGNDNLAAGVNADGSFGNGALELGFLWDPDGAAGPIPITGDLMWVGWRWDVWAWDWTTESGETGGESHAAPHIGNDYAIEWSERRTNASLDALIGSYTTDMLTVETQIVLLHRSDVIVHDIWYTPREDLSLLRVGRTVDPDQDYWMLDSYATLNTIGDGWVSGESALDERALALAGTTELGRLATPRLCTWCDTPDEMADSTGEEGAADIHPNVLVTLSSLAAGESMRVRFAYGFAIGGEAAGLLAVDSLSIDDLDDDGLSEAEGDCDDLDPDTFPGAVERADSLDNDCDGTVDEDTLEGDDDGDGFSETEGDCDDENPDVYPGAERVDGVTNADCDGVSDEPRDDAAEDTGSTDTGMDTGEASDTGVPESVDTPYGTGDSEDIAADGPIVIGKQGSGCSCSSSPTPGHLAWLVVVGLVCRRRTTP